MGLLLLLAGSIIFFYPDFREWKTQREVDRIAGKLSCQKKTGRLREAEGQIGNPDDGLRQKGETEQSGSADLEELYIQMQAYNERLFKEGQQLTDVWSFQQLPLDASMLPDEGDFIGYIEVPDMEVRMPLLLGASDENLARGAAVLAQTSMPIGGENTNCVIAGHRGYRGSAYFQHIESMREGSEVYIVNPWGTLTYRVMETKIITPYDMASISIQEGKDMVTLLSCHPYAGGGTYRYVVLCQRDDAQIGEKADIGDIEDMGKSGGEEWIEEAGAGKASEKKQEIGLLTWEKYVRRVFLIGMFAFGWRVLACFMHKLRKRKEN